MLVLFALLFLLCLSPRCTLLVPLSRHQVGISLQLNKPLPLLNDPEQENHVEQRKNAVEHTPFYTVEKYLSRVEK